MRNIFYGIVAVFFACAIWYAGSPYLSFAAITPLVSSDTQNTERATVNQLINFANNFSTTTSNTWTGHQIFSSFEATRGTTTHATSTSLYVTGLTSALSLFDANGQATEYAGAACTNQFARSVSAAGAWTCATVGTGDVSGLDISDDTNLAATYPLVLTGDTLSTALATTTHQIFSSVFLTRASSTHATSTNLDITSLLTFNGITGNSWDDFCTTITGGAGLCDGADATGSQVDPFGHLTNYATTTSSTSTKAWYTLGLFASSTSVFEYASSSALTADFLYGTRGAITYASSTAITVTGTGYFSGARVDTLTLPLISSDRILFTTTGGVVTNSSALTFPSGVLTTILANITYASSTAISVSGTGYFGTASTTNLTVSSMTSALLLTGTSGIVAEYAGSGACTSQFVTVLSALGAATCASISNDQWSGTDLAVANGGTGVSTFGGTNYVLYTTAADTLASEAAFTYNPTPNVLTFSYASSTAISASGIAYASTASSTSLIVSGIRSAVHVAGTDGTVAAATTQTCTNQFIRALSLAYVATCATVAPADVDLTASWDFGGAAGFEIPNGSAPTVDAIGESALDTTNNYLLVATSTNASFPAVFNPKQTPGGIFSTSTLTYMGSFGAAGTTTLKLPPQPFAIKITDYYCQATTLGSGTSTVRIGNGAASSTFAQAGNFAAANLTGLNISVASRGSIYIDFGALQGTPAYWSCDYSYLFDRT